MEYIYQLTYYQSIGSKNTYIQTGRIYIYQIHVKLYLSCESRSKSWCIRGSTARERLASENIKDSTQVVPDFRKEASHEIGTVFENN